MFILYNSFIIVLYEDSKECFGMAGARPDPIQDVSVTSLPKESKLKKKKKPLDRNNGSHRGVDVPRQLKPCYEL